MRMKRLRDSPLGVRTDHQAPDPRPMPSTDFHNSFESSPSHKPFPPANLTPTVSTLPRSFESLTSYPLRALTIVLPYHLNSALQPSLPPLQPISVYVCHRSEVARNPKDLPSFPYILTLLLPYLSFFKSLPCHTSENSPVSPPIATDPKMPLSKSFACHTSETPRWPHSDANPKGSLSCPNLFSCNTYGHSRKCCKQKTYGMAKPFRCNTYKNTGRGRGSLC